MTIFCNLGHRWFKNIDDLEHLFVYNAGNHLFCANKIRWPLGIDDVGEKKNKTYENCLLIMETGTNLGMIA